MNLQTSDAATELDEFDRIEPKSEAKGAQFESALLASYANNLALLPQYVDISWWSKLGEQKEAILRLLYPHHSLEPQAGNSQVAAPAEPNSQEPTSARMQRLRLQSAQALLAKVRQNKSYVLPQLTAFTGLKGRIGALPFNQALRFLRMRALAFRRSALRHCIDRASRERLYRWLESSVIDQLMKLPGTPRLDLLERSFDMPNLSQLEAEDLEWEGLCLLERDGLWEAKGPFVHLRLRFAQTRAPLPWIKGTIGHDGQVVEHFDPEGSAAVFALVGWDEARIPTE